MLAYFGADSQFNNCVKIIFILLLNWLIENKPKWAIFVCCFLLYWRNGRKPSDRAVRGQFVRGSHERVRKETRPECFRRTAKCLAEFFSQKAKKLVG